MSVIKNILAVIGFLALISLVIIFSTATKGTGWEWKEESKVNSSFNKNSYISIERGLHRDASDRVRVILKAKNETRELWSSYMQTEPVVNWLKADTIGISYKKEESHSYFPKVTIGESSYNIILSYK